jgi:hypothetical protein
MKSFLLYKNYFMQNLSRVVFGYQGREAFKFDERENIWVRAKVSPLLWAIINYLIVCGA